jgi:hypothetical protein
VGPPGHHRGTWTIAPTCNAESRVTHPPPTPHPTPPHPHPPTHTYLNFTRPVFCACVGCHAPPPSSSPQMPFSEEGGLSEQADRIARGAYDRAEPTWSALSPDARALVASLLTVDASRVRGLLCACPRVCVSMCVVFSGAHGGWGGGGWDLWGLAGDVAIMGHPDYALRHLHLLIWLLCPAPLRGLCSV